MAATQQVFKALSDDIRLRILRAVSMAEVSVAELVQVLGLPQSTVSRHLKPLRDAELVEPRREATSVYYHTGPEFRKNGFQSFLAERLSEVERAGEDRASVRRVLDARRSRSREFFDKVAGQYRSLTQPGGGWQALAAAFAAGFRGHTIADLGAGEGDVSLLLAPYARRVIAVDLSPRMLGTLAERAEQDGLSERVETREGDLDRLPLSDGEADTVILSQALHHAAQPAQAVREAARVCRPGGCLLILDLAQHEQTWVREEWADLWMGFAEADLERWIGEAGLTHDVTRRLHGSTPDLSVLVVTGRKPDG